MTSIQKLFLRNMIVIAFISIGTLYFLWIQNEYTSFVCESENMKEAFNNARKEQLEYEVRNVMDYIRYMRDQTEKRLKTSIRERVEDACRIALNIYHENAGVRPDNEIRKMIKDALRPIRFNNGRGYYFAFDMDGIEELFADRPEMEGQNMLQVQGANGEFVVRDMIDILKKQKQGFYSYTWSKPENREQNFRKIAFVKYFEPYGWGIGTGEYVDDVEVEIQTEVLERIAGLRFGKEGYFFGSVFGGRPLFTNGKITRDSENIWEMTDPDGIKIIQEQQAAARKPGGGFVRYSWPKIDSETLSPKMVYVNAVPEWEWIIGAGLYLDTVEADILLKEKSLWENFFKKAVLSFSVFLFIILLIFFLAGYTARKIQKGIKSFSDFFEKASLESTPMDTTDLQFSEFKDIAAFANHMLKNRLEAIQALKQSEKRYEAITSSAQDAIFCKDIHRQYTFVNPAMAGLFNCTRADLIGKVPGQLLEPDDAKIVAGVDDRTFNGESVSERYALLIHGKEHIFHTVQVPLEIRDGKVISISGIVRDITQSTLAARTLEAERKFIEAALNAQMDTFVVFNPETKSALRWNRSFVMVSKYSDSQIKSMKFPDDFYRPSDLEKADMFFEKILKNKPAGTLELSLLPASGPGVSFEYTASAVTDSGGTYIITIGRDITGRKQSEKEKRIAEHRAVNQEKHALVGQIAGKISHDFNNILGVIMGNAELALMDCKEPAIQESLDLIYTQTLRGRNLTRNLIAFARDQEPRQEFININEKIDLVINLMRKELEGIRIVREYQADLPQILVDPGMMEHAMVNLLQNSIHALSRSDHPLITIRTSCFGRHVCFEIQDNGCGIPAQHLKGIFEPSFSLKGGMDVSGAYHKSIKGTGYGLANVKKYIEQHMGWITVSSEPGAGTRFEISIPVTEKELTLEEKKELKQSNPPVGKNILVVEDEPAIGEVLQRILTQAPCSHLVDIARNGRMAIDLFQEKLYDLVSLDYMLPGGVSGMDIYHRIRQENLQVPVLFISGNIEFLESIKTLKQTDPLVGHLSKPCRNKDYVAYINELLEKAMHERPDQEMPPG